jgi:antitoxin ParD1/3/4
MARLEDSVTISVEADVAILIREAVAEGQYASESDAIRSAFAELKARRDDLLGYTPDEIARLWDEGIASGPAQEADFAAIKREARERAGGLRSDS